MKSGCVDHIVGGHTIAADAVEAASGTGSGHGELGLKRGSGGWHGWNSGPVGEVGAAFDGVEAALGAVPGQRDVAATHGVGVHLELGIGAACVGGDVG